MSPHAASIQGFARALLLRGELEDKLAPARAADGAPLVDDPAAPELVPAPARAARLSMQKGGGGKLPPLDALSDPGARVVTLSRFAHHELQAVELFAWALLAFPTLPSALRRGMLGALAEEQEHLRLYCARLAAHGAALGDVPLSDYFWQQIPAILAAPHPALAFLCAQGLTLEQANLDFTLLYRDAFRRAGDEETAAVLQCVHDDEVGHVRLAALWAQRLGEGLDLDVYNAHVPFPLQAARAKGRRFDVAARRRAGLSDAFIAAVRDARPYDRP